MVATDAVDWVARLAPAVEAHAGRGSTLVVAVSGGGDSVALLHGLARLREALDLRLVVAHLDHGLRPESRDDAAFVGQLALDLGLFCVRERQELAARHEAEGGNLEALARAARYAFLEDVARGARAAAIVTAHTLDDQAETLLMNLLRGAGLEGLTGMSLFGPPPLPDACTPLLRPLLAVERATLRQWLATEGLTWREDATNDDVSRQRAYLRHELVPTLADRFPGVQQRLAQSATLLRDELCWIDAAVDQAWQQLAVTGAGGIEFVREAFLAEPVALQRHLLRRAYLQLAPSGTALDFHHVAEALDLAARGHSGQRAILPSGLFLHVERNRLWLGGAPAPPPFPVLEEPLILAGEGRVAGNHLSLEARAVGREALPAAWTALAPGEALLDADTVLWPLTLRVPRPGERWQPLGMQGQRVALDGWLSKHGVPAHLRHRVPLLVDASGTVLWVVGQQVGHYARVRAASDRLWHVVVHALSPAPADG